MSRYEASWQSVLHQGVSSREQVDALLSRVPHATVFNTPEWCQAAAQALRADQTLVTLTVRDGDTLVAWLPLVSATERVHGIAAATLRLLGYPFNDRAALLMLPGDAILADMIMDTLSTCPQHWDLLVLSELYDGQERSLVSDRARGAIEWRPCSR